MSGFFFLKDEGLTHIVAVLAKGGGEARVVGGAVRDSLLGKTRGEIDLACNLPPEMVMAVLTGAGMKVVPTGIDHGTVTAVYDHKGYEITTLRHDVEPLGRRARVAFTDDWQADAARRDFTFNALYVDGAGKIYDYFEGQKDLKAGRVRFIGVAQERIKEDVLRILRFFRFQAWFGKGDADKEGLAACRELAGLIPHLSVERVWREIIKLLAAENPLGAWQLMQETGVLDHVMPEAGNIARLGNLLKIETKYEAPCKALVRLAALLPAGIANAAKISQRMKLSNKEAEKLRAMLTVPQHLKGKLDPVPFRRALYQYGAEDAADAALLLGADEMSSDLEPALAAAAAWEKPQFPVQGEDILKMGVAAGPKVGEILKVVEEWWMAQDFRPPRDECLKEAKKLV